jgi:hypothetical protein
MSLRWGKLPFLGSEDEILDHKGMSLRSGRFPSLGSEDEFFYHTRT